jgi:hypothetical protein
MSGKIDDGLKKLFKLTLVITLNLFELVSFYYLELLLSIVNFKQIMSVETRN